MLTRFLDRISNPMRYTGISQFNTVVRINEKHCKKVFFITCMTSTSPYAHWIEYVPLFILHVSPKSIYYVKCKKSACTLTV